VQHLPRPVLFGAALVFLALAFALLAFARGPISVLAAGMLIGLGHSIAYPTLGVWVEQQFAPAQQGMPLALFNALFTLGIYLLPLIGGYVIAAFGLGSMVLALAFACALVAAALLLRAHRAPRAPAPRRLPEEP
jgi:predicted MFS family arabinose efflux permease